MIVYFDILLVDDDSFTIRHSERYRRLSKLVHCHKGESALVKRQIINFSSRIAAEELREAFASCVINREGLVLKPDEPYFSFGIARRGNVPRCVKLKKGYNKNMGDVGDFAVVGARYDATAAKSLKLPEAKYTHFYLGCLTNSEEVKRFPGVTPEFTVVNEVEVIATKLQYFQLHCFTNAVAFEKNNAFTLTIPPGLLQDKKITTIFTKPAVFEMTCLSFQRAPNTRFWSLRFPYVSKIHCDREWQQCVSFQELQRMTEVETTAPEKEGSQELAQWIEALERADSKLKETAEDQKTQSTETTVSTVSTAGASSRDYSDVLPAAPVRETSVAAAESGLTTPPKSSGLEARGSSPQGNVSNQNPARKRRRVASPSSPRRSKARTDEIKVIDLTSPPPSRNYRDRQPLGDITASQSSQGNMLQTRVPRLPRAETFHETPGGGQSS